MVPKIGLDKQALPTGFEPATPNLGNLCSSPELREYVGGRDSDVRTVADLAVYRISLRAYTGNRTQTLDFTKVALYH